jgi:hypothetical protein
MVLDLFWSFGFGSVLTMVMNMVMVHGYRYGPWLSISLNGIVYCLFSLWIGYGYIKAMLASWIRLDLLTIHLVL